MYQVTIAERLVGEKIFSKKLQRKAKQFFTPCTLLPVSLNGFREGQRRMIAALCVGLDFLTFTFTSQQLSLPNNQKLPSKHMRRLSQSQQCCFPKKKTRWITKFHILDKGKNYSLFLPLLEMELRVVCRTRHSLVIVPTELLQHTWRINGRIVSKWTLEKEGVKLWLKSHTTHAEKRTMKTWA